MEDRFDKLTQTQKAKIQAFKNVQERKKAKEVSKQSEFLIIKGMKLAIVQGAEKHREELN